MKAIKFQIALSLLLAGTAYSVKAQKGMLYPKFPESFESKGDTGTDYQTRSMELLSGKWTFVGSRLDSTGNDRPTSGEFAIRMIGYNPQPVYAQMDFDVVEGASKVIIWYSSYGAKADKPSKFTLEYSTDKGKSWEKAGEEITAKSKIKQAAKFDLDIKGRVRFRIAKAGLGGGKKNPGIENGRLSLDDFSIYKNEK
ncbi:hypothetical protein ACSBL2_13610 [Pedobacter sp. AW31-3R]|uniref:hypothetical protein n=1 Tax=Pedobacter sp. AW31-3R TaxID=3445781 RepID=UPI003FA01DE7